MKIVPRFAAVPVSAILGVSPTPDAAITRDALRLLVDRRRGTVVRTREHHHLHRARR